MEKYYEELKQKSKELILKDGESILQVISEASSNGIINLLILPYLALYCRSVQEFYGKIFISENIDKQINDLRNGIKLYSGKYKKGKEETLKTDQEQDDYFRNMLRFKFMKKWNVHYNLGIYFNEEYYIIGNTQNMNYYLNIPNIGIEEKNRKAYELGVILRKEIHAILAEYGTEEIGLKEKKKTYKFGYIDCNTNKKNKFFCRTDDKEINLIMLHILSSIGFIEHVLIEILSDDNPWKKRVEYITAHYVWTGLKKIKQHFESDDVYSLTSELTELLEKGKAFFPSNFRNCMMHYDLCDKNGDVVIQPEHYNAEKPFFGLIESCFDGKEWNTFWNELKMYIMEMENYLSAWFKIDRKKIKWDL